MSVAQRQIGQGPKGAVAIHFRRKEEQIHTKRLHKKIKLRTVHIIFSFLILSGFFLILQQICLFALSWDKLDIKNIFVSCNNPVIKSLVEDRIRNYAFGNILLFEGEKLEGILESYPKVKSVEINKIFPISLRIRITERLPFALIDKDAPSVIDAEGVVIGKEAPDSPALPLLLDKSKFRENYREKIELAKTCLEDLSPRQRELIAVLDVSENRNVKIQFRDSLTWLILGDTHFSENVERYFSEKSFLERYGQLEYVDLRFQDRFFLKAYRGSSGMKSATTAKEVN